MLKHIRNPILRTFIVLGLITFIAVIAIAYGRGYRFTKDETGNNIVAGTGLLVMTSTPDGARAFIDDELSTATDDTINLKPGKYTVRIEKDGYFPWKKEIEITNEQVTETNALLFPKAPQLTSLTTTGVTNPVMDKEKQLIVYTVASASSELNGIYAMNLNRGIIPIGDIKRQIASNLIDTFSDSIIEVSPDGSQILSTIYPVGSGSARTYILNTTEFNPSPLLVTARANQIRDEWKLEAEALIDEKIKSLSRGAQGIINDYFTNPVFSPEKDKVVYIASSSATLPLVIKPSLPSTNSTPESRNIIEGNMYIYNIKDDRNYLLQPKNESEFPEFTWHPDNRHLYFIESGRINAIEYDGKNTTTVYAGPFIGNFLAPSPDGTGIVILTGFNDPSIPPNLYRLIFK